MQWYTVELKDPKTGERYTTNEKCVSQYGAELLAAQRIVEADENLEVLWAHER